MQVELHCQAVSVQHKKYTRVLKKQIFRWSPEQRSGELPAPTQPTASPVKIIGVDQCEDWNCAFGQSSCLWGGCLCVSKESVYSNTVLSACYKMILFSGKTRKRLVACCQHKDGTRWLQNGATFQSGVLLLPVLSSREETPYSHPSAAEEVHSCSLSPSPLQARSYFIWGQTDRQLPGHHLHSSEFGVGREQQWGSQGCAWGGDELKWLLGPAPAESCTDRQEHPVAETIHSHRPAQEQVCEDKKKLIGQGSLIVPFLFPVSCVVPYLAYALGSPGVSELLITAGKAP